MKIEEVEGIGPIEAEKLALAGTSLTKSNALALAIGVIIGAALGDGRRLGSSTDIIMPPHRPGALGGVDFSETPDRARGRQGRFADRGRASNCGVFLTRRIVFVVVRARRRT